MQMRRLSMISVLLLLLSSCGNPITLQKDLNREEEQRKNADNSNKELQLQLDSVKSFLLNIYVSSNNLWIATGLASYFDRATFQCSQIGYKLPDFTAMEEFKSELVPKNPAWSNIVDQIFLTDQSNSADAKYVFCRLPRK